MATQSKTMNAGPVGLKPKGDYSASVTYTLLDCVKYNHDSWVCKAMDAQGNPATVKGKAPADGSQYWQALTDGGAAAHDAATAANTAASNATQQGNEAEAKGNAAEVKGNFAQTQGDYAKAWGDNPPYVGNGTTGDKDYWYLYNIKTRKYEKSSYAKGDNLDYSTMTAEEYQRLVDDVKSSVMFATPQTCEAIINELK